MANNQKISMYFHKGSNEVGGKIQYTLIQQEAPDSAGTMATTMTTFSVSNPHKKHSEYSFPINVYY